ncbi:IS5 family transposase [Paracoccus sp. 08]|uniref:IS5 family transposase n=3 Tax=Paracoccus sp. 08 TaxID=2606624 RepID=UPI0020952608|nr:IS5 family transposase [Paracoccus sp. 08]
MSDLFWLTDAQMTRLAPYFPKAHGKPRVDDRRVLSGIIFIIRNGLRWRDAPTAYGPHKTLYSRWRRWSEKAKLFITAGQVSDYIKARALLSSLPKVKWLLGDRGYDADWLREALQDKGIRVCIPGRKQRKTPVKYDKRRYKRRSRIEIMFGRLKDWRRVAIRYDRCPKVFLSAIVLAALVICWL